MPLENRTRFDPKDLELIKHGPERVIGSVAAYNSPPFGDSDRDFVELNIYDLNDNYIQTVILSSEDWVIQNEDIKVRPGEDLRKLGFQSGEYKVEYNFFREMGGSENSVLIDEDSRIYNGDFEFNSQGKLIAADGSNKKLELIDNKYFIHDISPDRTEVRLAPHKIQNSKYKSEFEQLQSDYSFITSDSVRVAEGFDSLRFIHTAVSGSETGSFTNPEDSVNISLALAPGDVGFTPEMAGSDLLIEDVFYFGDEADTFIEFGADTAGTNWGTPPYTDRTRDPDRHIFPKFNEHHSRTLKYDQSDYIDDDGNRVPLDYDAFYAQIYYNAPNHEADDDDMAEAAFNKRSNLASGLLHKPFIQKNVIEGRIISQPIAPGLRGARDNGIMFTPVIRSTLNVKKMLWTFTNNGRPDTQEFRGNSFTVESGGPNEYIIPYADIIMAEAGFGNGQHEGITSAEVNDPYNFHTYKGYDNPWLVEHMTSPTAFDELGASQHIGFTSPGIYDVKLTVTFEYGLKERTLQVEKKRYLQVQPDYNPDDVSLGNQEGFVSAL
jgi:hypothetical protein